MPLEALATKLRTELTSLSSELTKFAAGKPASITSADFTTLDECLLEGLLSHAWQSWSRFCRQCIIESCIGSVTSGGNLVAGIAGIANDAQVSAAAMRAKKNQNPIWNGSVNTVLRFEPTWGDIDVLNNIVTKLNPSNAAQLLAALSTAHASAKALQKIRNGAAHNNHQTLADIQLLGSAYLVFPISHPTQALYWIDTISNGFLVIEALEELADSATSAVA